MSQSVLDEHRLDVKNVAGRVLAIRLAAPTITPAEMDAFRDKLKVAAGRIAASGKKVVVATDMRELHIMSPETAKFVIELMQSGNPMLERSGILISPHATFSLQLGRITAESGFVHRRKFSDVASLLEWLGEVLTQDEIAHIKSFFKHA